MKNFLFIVLILFLLAGCQNDEMRDNAAEFNLENISLSAFENSTKYFIVTPF
ncbi:MULTISPECIES: hypothetical protein [Paraliobacillus]|uniref:hypothetical protein n=1 Tax=Paraliobacillus TaxID=200903 RepID=UPI00130081A7|nr:MULTISPECIES: hypothetical protein [Paraliobacillus]